MKKDKYKQPPDYLIIPYRLITDKDLTPIDRIVYGTVYWFAGLKHGCIASNASIAEIANTKPNSVSRSLANLEAKRYVIIRFEDKEKKKRIEIIPLVIFSKIPSKGYSRLNNVKSLGLFTGDEPPTQPCITPYSALHNVDKIQTFPENSSIEPSNGQNEVGGVIHRRIEKQKDSIISNHNIYIAASQPEQKHKNGKSSTILKTGKTKPDGKFNSTTPPVSYETPSDSSPTGSEINDAIALFLVILPGDFIGAKTAFAKPATREAVKALLKRYTLGQLRELIRKYDEGKADQYRPQVGTVYEFCTIKLAKVEAYVAKSGGGGLYANKPISSQEHSQRIEDLIHSKAEQSREKMRLAKEQWEKDNAK